MLSTDHTNPRRPRLTVVAADVVGNVMAGPGIRFTSVAHELADVADVTLAVGPDSSDIESLLGLGFEVASYADSADLANLISASDIAFCQLIDPAVVRAGLAAGCRFIFDLYNALPAEAIGSERIGGFDTQPDMDRVFADVVDFFRFCMRAGSYFVTSNERQRDFWIGYMIASDGLKPSELEGRTAEEVVGLLPFGMEEEDPVRTEPSIRAELGIPDDAFVMLWAGGIWDWFDAETPIRAVAELVTDPTETHLVFYGTTHPNPLIGEPPAAVRARDLARSLGLLGNRVHFVEGWVPANERARYLLDADIAISGHKESFETRYAFRTRILDHFWARLPSIVTEGDWFAEYIAKNELGCVVEYSDVSSTVAAIRLLQDDTRRGSIEARVDALRANWSWSATSTALREVVRTWDTSLRIRTSAQAEARTALAPAPGPDEPSETTRLGRMRRLVSSSPIGALYRQLRRAVSRHSAGHLSESAEAHSRARSE